MKRVYSYKCGECGRLWGDDEEGCRECCTSYMCECGREHNVTAGSMCVSCQEKDMVIHNRRLLDNAELCEYDGGPIFVKGCFIETLGKYQEFARGFPSGEELAHLAKALKVEVADDAYRDVVDMIEKFLPHGVSIVDGCKFREAINEFVEANDTVRWIEDKNRKVRLTDE